MSCRTEQDRVSCCLAFHGNISHGERAYMPDHVGTQKRLGKPGDTVRGIDWQEPLVWFL